MNGPVLRDIHLPPAHWWPPAPGWWLLAVLLLLAAIGIAWGLRRRARSHPLRVALREIDALEAAHARDGNTTHLADGASRLMRRVALRVAPEVATQTGATWRAFVLVHATDETVRHALDELTSERFRAQPVLDAPTLLAALRAWCRNALRAQARGDEAPEAKAILLNPPSFRRGRKTRFLAKKVAPKARGDETRAQEEASP